MYFKKKIKTCMQGEEERRRRRGNKKESKGGDGLAKRPDWIDRSIDRGERNENAIRDLLSSFDRTRFCIASGSTDDQDAPSCSATHSGSQQWGSTWAEQAPMPSCPAIDRFDRFSHPPRPGLDRFGSSTSWIASIDGRSGTGSIACMLWGSTDGPTRSKVPSCNGRRTTVSSGFDRDDPPRAPPHASPGGKLIRVSVRHFRARPRPPRTPARLIASRLGH